MTVAARPATVAGSSGSKPGALRPGAAWFVGCVLALAVGGGLLGLRLLQPSAAHVHAHAQPGPLGVAVPTSFGQLEVESVAQIRGLTPKALAGVTHGIQSLVRADEMQVQLVLALKNESGRPRPFDAGAFRIRVGRGGSVKTFEPVSTSVRAGVLAPKSTMETTIGFVVKRFNAKGSRLTLVFNDPGQAAATTLDLGPVRPAGATAASIKALYLGHHH